MKFRTKDGCYVHLDGMHIFDYHACVLLGQPTEDNAKRAAVREMDRVFGESKPMRIVGPLVYRMICMVGLISYETLDDADGRHLVIIFSLPADQLDSVFQRTGENLSEIDWNTSAATFYL